MADTHKVSAEVYLGSQFQRIQSLVSWSQGKRAWWRKLLTSGSQEAERGEEPREEEARNQM